MLNPGAIALRTPWPTPAWLAPVVGYLRALGVTAACTVAALLVLPDAGLVNIVMIYLLGTTLAALRLDRGASVLMCVGNMLALDFFFVPPRFSFDVEDAHYLFILVVMLCVAMVIANLMIGIRRHREIADTREWRTAVLYAMSREIAIASDAPAMAAAAMHHVSAVFNSSASLLVTDDAGQLVPVRPAAGLHPHDQRPDLSATDIELAGQAARSGERRVAAAIYMPLRCANHLCGVLVVRPQPPTPALRAEQLALLDAFGVQLGLSLQRVRLGEAAEAARISTERATLLNTLLASISHDLRTPLSAIASAGSMIAQPDYALNVDRRTTLGLLIERKARDMAQLLSNVLELTQLECGAGTVRADWYAIDDLVALALRSNEARLAQWRVVVNLPADLPLLRVDATLIVQVFSNLLENAAKYTPPGTTISISAAVAARTVVLYVADDGPGLPPGDTERLFQKFQRGRSESNIVGVGLGLAICRAAARLHGGEIRALENPGGGALFELTLPLPAYR